MKAVLFLITHKANHNPLGLLHSWDIMAQFKACAGVEKNLPYITGGWIIKAYCTSTPLNPYRCHLHLTGLSSSASL